MTTHRECIGYCDCCEEKIYDSAEWVENEDGALVCKECLEEFTVDDWLEFTHHKYGTSSINYEETMKEAMEDDGQI